MGISQFLPMKKLKFNFSRDYFVIKEYLRFVISTKFSDFLTPCMTFFKKILFTSHSRAIFQTF